MVYNSVMELLIGVPVAKVIPRPPVSSSMYRHFVYISVDFCASVCPIPATLRIFVYRKRFLKLSASSTNSRSAPSSSKVTTSSFLLSSFRRCSLVSRLFRVFSICLMVKVSPCSCIAWSIPHSILSICSRIMATWRSFDTGIFSNCECPIITAS